VLVASNVEAVKKLARRLRSPLGYVSPIQFEEALKA